MEFAMESCFHTFQFGQILALEFKGRAKHGWAQGFFIMRLVKKILNFSFIYSKTLQTWYMGCKLTDLLPEKKTPYQSK